MRHYVFLLLLIAGLSACARRPVQQDLPHSQGNSVDHSRQHNLAIETSPNASSAPYDLQFLDTMIAQHEAVIDMAQLAQTRASTAKIKALAQDIITRHRAEIAEMRGVRDKYFGGAGPAINIDLPGASDSFGALDLERLDDLKEKPFDLEFTRELTDTFKGSVLLAQDAPARTSNETEASISIHRLAQEIVENRNRDLQDLRE